jgi:regulator of protease activity HflC (stomatin/prohibitin superfamily)
VIHAEGEFQAAEKLRDAAETIENYPMAMQMRFLQTLVEVGSENNSTIVFPMPIDLLKPLMQSNAEPNGQPRQPEPLASR